MTARHSCNAGGQKADHSRTAASAHLVTYGTCVNTTTGALRPILLSCAAHPPHPLCLTPAAGSVIKKADLVSATDDKTYATNSLPHYYTVDWQKAYVRVYADGALLTEFNSSANAGWSSPNKPALLRLSLWSVAGLYSGPIAAWQVAYSSFFDARRIVCNKAVSAAGVRPDQMLPVVEPPVQQQPAAQAAVLPAVRPKSPPPARPANEPPAVNMPPGHEKPKNNWAPAPAAP